jgi:hypothetical protein
MERGRIKVIPSSDVALRVAVEECRAVCSTADDLRRALRRQFPEVQVLERADALMSPDGPPLVYISRRSQPYRRA